MFTSFSKAKIVLLISEFRSYASAVNIILTPWSSRWKKFAVDNRFVAIVSLSALYVSVTDLYLWINIPPKITEHANGMVYVVLLGELSTLRIECLTLLCLKTSGISRRHTILLRSLFVTYSSAQCSLGPSCCLTIAGRLLQAC